MMSISELPGRTRQRAGRTVLAIALLLAGAACTTTERPDASGEVAIGYDGAGKPRTLLLMPVDGGVLTSSFGIRKDPMGGGGTRRHLGTDYGAPAGSPVRAAGDGIVASVGPRGSYGNYVLIRHGHTYATGYAHLTGFADGLWSGQQVRQSQVIGYVGSTGRSTGPHLHFEVYEKGERIDPYDLDPVLGGTTVARGSFNILDTASETLAAAADKLSLSDASDTLWSWGNQAKEVVEENVLTPLDLQKYFDGFGEEAPDVITE